MAKFRSSAGGPPSRPVINGRPAQPAFEAARDSALTQNLETHSTGNNGLLALQTEIDATRRLDGDDFQSFLIERLGERAREHAELIQRLHDHKLQVLVHYCEALTKVSKSGVQANSTRSASPSHSWTRADEQANA